MRAPLGGACYLIDNGEKLKLSDWSGGPIIWNETSDKVALPVWTKQRNQKIAIVDITERTLTTYKEEFRVLHFNKFSKNILSGIDSPAYKSIKINFEINKEKTDSIIQFK